VQAPSFNFKRGFGLRTFKDDATKYSYSASLDEKSVNEAVKITKSPTTDNLSPIQCIDIPNEKHSLYDNSRFIDTFSLDAKVEFLKSIDIYARSKSGNVKQAIAVLAGSWQVISIVNECGQKTYDIRPLVRLSVSIIVEKNGALESGIYSGGGRLGYASLINESTKVSFVDEALRQANVKLEAIKAPVGEMAVVLGNAWTGILLHEAVGHGLEGDAIRKKTSSFHNLLGEQIASSDITVIDDGSIENRRGSINIDDEGTSSQRNILIENGKLVGFMQDRMNANLMNTRVTGNGRREGFEHLPVPRMTNTFMLAGKSSFEEMVSRVKNGVFAKSFSDGQVDIASGKFVFSASEAYLIENGKVTVPIKGAMLIGDGPSILKKISMVGNDFSLDPGVGTCGKDGQWVPVGVGQSSVLIDKITVGGSNL
jgi:TldD protein